MTTPEDRNVLRGKPSPSMFPLPTENQVIRVNIKLESGEMVQENFIVGKMLGKGKFSYCFEMECLANNVIYACKIFDRESMKSSSQGKRISTEIKLLRDLDHPNIVKYYFYGLTSLYFIIFIERCSERCLKPFLRIKKRLREMETRYFIVQLAEALKFLHEKNIIHRDIKPDNVFIHQMKVKLGDFGLSTKLADSTSKTNIICGTPNYIAPEILNEKYYGPEVDIWSLGVLVYTMLIGYPPFETKDIKTTYDRIKRCDYSYPSHIELSKETKHFIARCLDLNPETRITCEEVLKHPFLTEYPIPKELFIEYQGDQMLLVPRLKKSLNVNVKKRSLVDHPGEPMEGTIPSKAIKYTVVDENSENASNTVITKHKEPSKTTHVLTPKKLVLRVRP